ncbi:ferredoxin [Jatrophihabitans sp.]|uniref:ferredoxin n=1 Tax=Jatrophihabitans sp. TaxID=1932789 RepID=UPI0030C6A787|nr:ferredoxin [Jatrophihabitans sp.]
MTRLDIDWTRCDGHGLCAELLPHRITRDDWGFPIISPAPASAKELKRAVTVCPALALRLTRS